MKTVHVKTDQAYWVRIERGSLAQAGGWLAGLTRAPRAALVTDDVVDALYGDAVATSLRDAGFAVARLRFANGEASKTLATYGAILEGLAENRLTRSDVVVALGGGVTGDMAGFAAATYLRGIPVAQIPTTLLAMVDSSVGGKTGVDLPAGKNLAGAFHQPIGVLCDPDVLATLPADVYADGMAEVLKYGVLCDANLFDTLAKGDLPAAAMEGIIERCVAIKASVCAGDECDRGSRQLLNLGHTFGHAIERCSGYQTSHGHAVAVGMVYAMRIAVHKGLCGQSCLPRLMEALTRNGLPTASPYVARDLAEAALHDKKRTGDTLLLALPTDMGHCGLYPVPVCELESLAAVAIGTPQVAATTERK